MSVDEQYISVREFCDAYAVNPVTWYRIFRHRVPWVKVGRAVRIPRSAIGSFALGDELESQAQRLQPTEWLRREISSGRLAELPSDELLAVLAEAIRGRTVLAPTKCAATGSTPEAALREGTATHAAAP